MTIDKNCQWKAYVVICLSLLGLLTLTGATLKQILSPPFLNDPTGIGFLHSVKVQDSVTCWVTMEGLTYWVQRL